MNDERPPAEGRQLLLIDRLCCEFEQLLQQKQHPAIALYLDQAPRSIHTALFQELLALEIEYARKAGRTIDRARYERMWPHFAAEVADVFKSDEPPKKPVLPTPMTIQNKFCVSCKEQIPSSAKFCGYCGTAQPSDPKPEIAEPTDPPPPPPPIEKLVEKPVVEVIKPVAIQQVVSVSLPKSSGISSGNVVEKNDPKPRPTTGGIVLPKQHVAVSLDDPIMEERRDARADLVSPPGSLRKMVLIPTGRFMMGSPDGVGEEDERPQHLVLLDAYYIDQSAVTNIEYEQCDPNHRSLRQAVSSGDDDPVVMVNYDDCLRYCRWRSLREGLPAGTYMLPSEAQWERAARGGYPDRIYPWGNTIDASYCNSLEAGRWRTLPATSGLPNGFQLYFMGSNVREWCFDYYSRTYYTDQQTWQNPQGPPINVIEYFRVVRGACFSEKAVRLGRCAARGRANPLVMQTDIGFRCVRLVSL